MKRALLLIACVGILGCDKQNGEAPKGSGPLAAAEKDLFKQLPGGVSVVFGGNYKKLQKLMSGSLGKAVNDMASRLGPGTDKWMDCWTEAKNMRLAGAATVMGTSFDLATVMTGMTITDLKACADKASFQATVDPDGKYIEITLPPPASAVGYLALPSGAVFGHEKMLLGGRPTMTPTTRAELEANVAAAAKSSALDDPKLADIVAKTDRSKDFWFAGSGATTPISDKLGEIYGTFDFSSGLAIDVTAQVTDSGVLDKLEDGVKQAKKSADQMPGEMKNVIQAMQFSRKGDHVHFALKLSDEQISGVMKQLGMFGGMR
jgi:hypothetical protein